MMRKTNQISNGVNVSPKIFKAYDIRGLYSQEINGDTARFLGQAFVVFLKKKASKSRKLKIAVGRDNRVSSPILYSNLVRGITAAGADVIDLGLATTPIFYFAVVRYRCDGGVLVTASHNPKEYNGFKMVREKAIPISEESGIREIQKLTQSPFQVGKSKGRVIKSGQKIIKDYVVFNLRGIKKSSFKGLKVVIDTANAVSGIIIPEIFKNLPCKISHLFAKSDGRFPNHPPDPLIAENLRTIRAAVLNKKADLGVAFDGDGDRVIFIDEKGEIASANFITALLSTLVLKDNPGAKILYDVRSSNVIKETIKKEGGAPVIWRIGHSFIKEKMRKDKILFAAEFSGHYYHQKHYFCEAPFFVLFKLLQVISKKPLSELLKPYQKYFHSGEINLEIADKKAAIGRLKNRYATGRFLEIDGLRVDFDDWWFLARPSNTEPVLRLVIEAKTEKLLAEKKKELLALLKTRRLTRS